MGYLLHITRRQRWSDDGPGAIERREWEAIVRADPDLLLYNEAEADEVDPCYRLNIPDLDHAFSFNERSGVIDVARGYFDEVLPKALEIAWRLGAVVEGDEGEYYQMTAAGKTTTWVRPSPDRL